jgi:hypothetical protein
MNNSDPNMYYAYEYGEDGFHSGKVEVKPDDLLNYFNKVVALAKEMGKKIIITDEMDYCVFHMENGKIIFPRFSDA